MSAQLRQINPNKPAAPPPPLRDEIEADLRKQLKAEDKTAFDALLRAHERASFRGGAIVGGLISGVLVLLGILTFQAATIREAGDMAGKSAVSGMLLGVQRDAGKR